MASRYPAFLTRIQQSPVIRQLEQQPAEWILVVGVVLGAGLGTVALFGVGGIAGTVLCLMALGGAFLLSLGAEPVLREAASIPDLLEMVELPGGTFLMGSPDWDGQAYDSEKPQHPVTVSAFAMSRYLVTRRLYRQVMKRRVP